VFIHNVTLKDSANPHKPFYDSQKIFRKADPSETGFTLLQTAIFVKNYFALGHFQPKNIKALEQKKYLILSV
jgi:hypothetical protein